MTELTHAAGPAARALEDLTDRERAELGHYLLVEGEATAPLHVLAANAGLTPEDAQTLVDEAWVRWVAERVAAGVILPRRVRRDRALPPPIECPGGLTDLILEERGSAG